MFCTRCGEKLKEDNLYCPACGHKVENVKELGKQSPNIVEKKPMPMWFKALATLAFLALIAVTVAIIFAQSPKKTIEGQLRTFKKEKISDAYYKYTAKDFQKATSFEEFKDFVQENPIFLEYLAFRLGKSHIRNQVGVLKATLFGEKGENIVIEYQLGKEDGKWKILNMSILDEETDFETVSEEEKKEMEEIIEKQLDFLTQEKIEEAYQETKAKDFQNETTLEAFHEFLEENSFLFDATLKGISVKGKLEDKAYALVLLETEKDFYLVNYILILDDGSWKIWRLDLSTTFDPVD